MVDGTEVTDGELQPNDELTLQDIQDLEEEDDNDAYTTGSCRQTLAKVCSFSIVFYSLSLPY